MKVASFAAQARQCCLPPPAWGNYIAQESGFVRGSKERPPTIDRQKWYNSPAQPGIGKKDMPPFETRSSQFGLVSGIRQTSSDMVLVAEPAGLFAPEARKGQLYIVAEADQDVARGRDACQLASRTIRKLFYGDSSYSVTSALRKAISAANKALYEHNFSVSPAKRAVVGVTCAVIKGNDLYIAQILPAQSYVLSDG